MKAFTKTRYTAIHMLFAIVGTGMFMWGIAPKIEAYIHPVHQAPLGVLTFVT